GYPDEKIRRLCREGVARGWSHFKIKVGRDLQDDMRRAALVRQEIGPNRKLMVDANQVWDVNQAIAWMHELARFDPWWIEEPTSPDDVLGHATIAKAVAPIGVATGEQCQNRVVFKQLMQAKAIRFCQVDSCRLGGVNEVLGFALNWRKSTLAAAVLLFAGSLMLVPMIGGEFVPQTDDGFIQLRFKTPVGSSLDYS